LTSNAKPSCFVANIDSSLAPKLEQGLQERGFSFSKPQYTQFQARKTGVTCTLYTSGKLVVQGKGKDELLEFYLEPEILQSFTYSNKEVYLDKTSRMGCDEAGKGDFFGPLCVAGVMADEEGVEALSKLGVADSKTVSDQKILKLAPKIRLVVASETVNLFPHKYNELYEKFSNLNFLLAWAHATVIENLSKKGSCEYALVDQFARAEVLERAIAKKQIDIVVKQETKAERDIVVAAASMLARADFLRGLERLEKEHDCLLPKGGGKQTLQEGKRILDSRGKEIFPKIAKVHFKNYREICGIN
jgi:ribonuclease HIII